MLYQKIYNQIIERARNRVLVDYSEKHHIFPKCLGGTDNKDNLVRLTYREHFICHWLLCKIYPKNYKIIHAFSRMIHFSLKNSERSLLLTSRHFETVKKYYYPIVGSWNKGKAPWNKGLTGESYKSRYSTGGLTPPNMTGYKWINDGTKQKKLKPGEDIPNGWKSGRLDMSGNKNPMRKKNGI